MNSLLKRVQKNLDNNWPVEKEDIQVLAGYCKRANNLLKQIQHDIHNNKTDRGAVIIGDAEENEIILFNEHYDTHR